MARPKIPVDELLLKKLTKLQLSHTVIADILNMSVDTLDRRFAEKMKAWRSECKGKIAEVLFDEGINKREPWALKALAQRHLGYHDKIKTENENTNHNYEHLSDDELDRRLADLEPSAPKTVVKRKKK